MSKKDDDFVLTDSQKAFLLLKWNEEIDLIELVREVTKDPKADGRHKAGRAIRDFFLDNGKKIKTTKYEAKGPIELTDEQKEYIRNNMKDQKPLQIARSLFNNDKLFPLNSESKAVLAYIKEIEPNFIKQEDDIVDSDEYESPKSIYDLIPIVNKYVLNPKKENEGMYNPNRLSAQDERNLRALLSYVNLPQFVQLANRYERKLDRELYVSTFIGMTHDKPDLLREEITQYISLASEIVTTAQIDRHIQSLDREVEDALSGSNNDKKKLSMTMVELINSARDKQDKSKERQKKLIGELIGSRAKRQENKIVANATVLNLVEAWQNDVEARRRMIQLAIEQKNAEKEEVKKIMDMESVVALVAGVTIEELTN